MTTPVDGSKVPVQDAVEDPAQEAALPADLQDERLIASHGVSGAIAAFTARLRSGDLGSVPVVVGLVIIWAVLVGLGLFWFRRHPLRVLVLPVVAVVVWFAVITLGEQLLGWTA